jgi:hypothetical protein
VAADLLHFSRYVGGWLGGWLVGSPIIMALRSPSCKLRLTRLSDRLKFQDGPSVAIIHLQGTGQNIQDSLEAYIASEEVESKCSECQSPDMVKT